MEDNNQPGATRVTAANSLLDRAWGKPLQMLAAEGGDSPMTLHLLATNIVGKQLLEEQAARSSVTIPHEPTNGQAAFDLNAPPPSE